MRTNKRAAILFLAVGAIAVLSILTLGTTSSVMTEMKLARTIVDADTGVYMGLTAADLSRVFFTNDDTPGIVTLYDMRNREIPLGDKVLRLSYADEEGLINIAKAPLEVVSQLPGLKDDATLAQDVFNAKPTVKEELLQIPNMTPAVYNQFKHLITVYGSGAVNINTAGSDVLTLLGFDQELIDAIKKFRASTDGVEGTQDDLHISTTGSLVATLAAYGITPAQQAFLTNLVNSGQLTAASDIIDVYASVVKGEKILRTYRIVLNVSTGNVMAWDEL